MNRPRILLAASAIAVSLGSAACIQVDEGETRRFEKVYSVSGPVTLDIQNGSGDVHVRASGDGRVRVQGEVRFSQFLLATGSRRRADEIAEKPPITQSGDLLRIVRPDASGSGTARINYTIEVPAKTEVRIRNGSGDVVLEGIDGPLNIDTGSADVQVGRIHQRVDISVGSGDISARDIDGELSATARSGDVTVDSVAGDIRVETTSGDIRIGRPGHKVSARANSGEVEIDGVSADLRVNTGSGDCRISGDPRSTAVWEIETRSGEALLDVSQRASFQLIAHSRSRIQRDIEMTVEEESRRDLRGRVGKGEARVRVETGSGRIRIY